MLSDTDKAAYTQNYVSDFAIGRHHQIFDIPHFFVILVVNRFSFQLCVKAFTAGGVRICA